MTVQRANLIEELIEELHSKATQAMDDYDFLRAEVIYSTIDWLKQEKNK